MFRLSPTVGLNLFKECPRCFWLHYNKKISRPRGIFPSLPGGMDSVIKEYFDRFRGRLPPEIDGKVEGCLFPDSQLLNKWRNWRTGLEYYDKQLDAVLFGALDDCLVDQGYYIPIDYKTKGSAPDYGDAEKYYQTQLDSYSLLLSSNGYKARTFAYLVYYFPQRIEKNGLIKFNIDIVKIKTDLERVKKILHDAVGLLKGPMPQSNNPCEYCSWVSNRITAEAKKIPTDLFE